jgi:hypothetical protein
VQLGDLPLTQRQIHVAEQRRRLLMGERQITGADLQDLALGAQPRHPQRRLVAPGEREPRASRHVIGQHRHRGPGFGVAQRMHVIEDQRDRGGHRRKRRPEPGGDRTGHRTRR